MHNSHMTNKKLCITIFTRLVATKPGRMDDYNKMLSTLNDTILLSLDHMKPQIKNFISPIPQALLKRNLTRVVAHGMVQSSKKSVNPQQKVLSIQVFYLIRQCVCDLKQGHYKITVFNMRTAIGNIYISKSLCSLTRNSQQPFVVKFC